MAEDRRRPEGTAPWLPLAWWDLPVERRRLVAAGLAATLVAVVVLGVSGIGGEGSDGGASADVAPADAFVETLTPERLATWDRLADCESNGDWSADTGNGFFGGLQFTQRSWEAMGGEGSPAAASRNEQIMRAERLHEEQGWSAWPSCSRQLGLR